MCPYDVDVQFEAESGAARDVSRLSTVSSEPTTSGKAGRGVADAAAVRDAAVLAKAADSLCRGAPDHRWMDTGCPPHITL